MREKLVPGKNLFGGVGKRHAWDDGKIAVRHSGVVVGSPLRSQMKLRRMKKKGKA